MTIHAGAAMRCRRHTERRYTIVGQAAHCAPGRPYYIVRREDGEEHYCQALTTHEIAVRFVAELEADLPDPFSEEAG